MTDDDSNAGELSEYQAELEASLDAGQVPDGWEYQVSWDARPGTDGRFAVAAAVVAAGLIAGWIAWGWKAGIAAGFVAVAVMMLLAVPRGGPTPGSMITETFTPPDETVAELGVAGHELVKVTRGRPKFTRMRPATSTDRGSIRRGLVGTAAMVIIFGTLTLLVESGRIGPTVYLRTGSILGAVAGVGLAVWLWVRMGAYSRSDTSDRESLTDGILGTATSGGAAVEAVGTGLLARLPPRVARVVGPGFILVWAAVSVLVAFSLAPPAGHLWSSAAAAADLIAFIIAGLRALLLASIALVKRDGSALKGVLLTLGLTGVLLLVAKLFGWLDDWTAVITWVRQR